METTTKETDSTLLNTGAAAGTPADTALRGALFRGDAWICDCKAINGNYNVRCWNCQENREAPDAWICDCKAINGNCNVRCWNCRETREPVENCAQKICKNRPSFSEKKSTIY